MEKYGIHVWWVLSGNGGSMDHLSTRMGNRIGWDIGRARPMVWDPKNPEVFTYKGQFDELQIFNYPLNATEVAALFTQDFLSTDKFNQGKSIVKVYPNPVKDVVNITIKDNSTLKTIELYDIQGRIVMNKKSDTTMETLNVENVSNGVYILSIENGAAKTTQKIIINK